MGARPGTHQKVMDVKDEVGVPGASGGPPMYLLKDVSRGCILGDSSQVIRLVRVVRGGAVIG